MRDVRSLLLPFGILTGLLLSACEPDHSYPPKVTENYMNACIKAGASRPVCQCQLDHIQSDYSVEEYQRLEQAIMRNDPQAVEYALLVVMQCMNAGS